MTTIKGIVRSYGAAVKRAERVQQKHNRETARKYKVQQKAQQLQNAAQSVTEYISYIEVLRSVHKDYSERINWEDMLSISCPEEPMKTSDNEKKAQHQIDHYKPSFFDVLFGRTPKKIENLTEALEQAKNVDESVFRRKLREFTNDMSDIEKLKTMAQGVMDKNSKAYKNAIEFFKPFNDLTDLSKLLNFKINPDYIEVEMEVMSYDFIPGYELSLTSTGKLSRKNMSTSKYYELFQEHVCSSVIRIAKEISNYFPVDYVVITVVINELDEANGHRVTNTKLSTLIPIIKIEDIFLDSINPVNCVKSFVHNMKFTRTNGFSNVSKIDIENNLLTI